VCREDGQIKGGDVSGPPNAVVEVVVALSALLALSTAANVGRVALTTVTPVPAADSFAVATGREVLAGILPSLHRKTQSTSHQTQIDRQNERKIKAVKGQAHARATTLVTKERRKVKENAAQPQR